MKPPHRGRKAGKTITEWVTHRKKILSTFSECGDACKIIIEGLDHVGQRLIKSHSHAILIPTLPCNLHHNLCCFAFCRSCWHQLPEKRPPASEILKEMEDPAFLCQCRLLPATDENLLEKVTAIYALSNVASGKTRRLITIGSFSISARVACVFIISLVHLGLFHP